MAVSAINIPKGSQISPATERVYHQTNLIGDWKGTWKDSGRQLEFKVARGKGRISLPGTSFETSSKITREVLTTGRSRMVGDLMDGSQIRHEYSGALIRARIELNGGGDRARALQVLTDFERMLVLAAR